MIPHALIRELTSRCPTRTRQSRMPALPASREAGDQRRERRRTGRRAADVKHTRLVAPAVHGGDRRHDLERRAGRIAGLRRAIEQRRVGVVAVEAGEEPALGQGIGVEAGDRGEVLCPRIFFVSIMPHEFFCVCRRTTAM